MEVGQVGLVGRRVRRPAAWGLLLVPGPARTRSLNLAGNNAMAKLKRTSLAKTLTAVMSHTKISVVSSTHNALHDHYQNFSSAIETRFLGRNGRALCLISFANVPKKHGISNTLILEYNIMESVTLVQKAGRHTKTKEYARTSHDLLMLNLGLAVLIKTWINVGYPTSSVSGNRTRTLSILLIKLTLSMVTIVIGQHGVHVLPLADLEHDTVHEVAQTLHPRSAVSRVTVWAVMKTLKRVTKTIAQSMVDGETGLIGVSVQQVVALDVSEGLERVITLNQKMVESHVKDPKRKLLNATSINVQFVEGGQDGLLGPSAPRRVAMDSSQENVNVMIRKQKMAETHVLVLPLCSKIVLKKNVQDFGEIGLTGMNVLEHVDQAGLIQDLAHVRVDNYAKGLGTRLSNVNSKNAQSVRTPLTLHLFWTAQLRLTNQYGTG